MGCTERELDGYLYSRNTNREKTSVAELTMGVPVRHHLHISYHVILGRACSIPTYYATSQRWKPQDNTSWSNVCSIPVIAVLYHCSHRGLQVGLPARCHDPMRCSGRLGICVPDHVCLIQDAPAERHAAPEETPIPQLSMNGPRVHKLQTCQGSWERHTPGTQAVG